MAAHSSATNSLLISRNALGSAVAKALCLYVGRGRRYSVKQVSNATGVPDRQIECAKLDPEGNQAEAWRPLKPEELLSIASFLGENFTTEWLRLAKQGAFGLPDEELPSPGEIVAACAEDTSDVADAAADGHFDNDDRRTLRKVGLHEIDRGMKLVAAGRGS